MRPYVTPFSHFFEIARVTLESQVFFWHDNKDLNARPESPQLEGTPAAYTLPTH